MQIMGYLLFFIDLSPTASFQSYDQEMTAALALSGTKSPGEDCQGKTCINLRFPKVCVAYYFYVI